MYVGLIGFGYAIYVEYPGIKAYVYFALAAAFTVIIAWMFFDLYLHLADQRQYDAVDTDIGSKHFLCADPMCRRCKGYWLGLSSMAMVTLTLYQKIIELSTVYGVDPDIIGVTGFVIFIVTTPLHGAINSVVRMLFGVSLEDGRMKRRINYLLGFLSGFSISLIVIWFLIAIS
jgi:hypothetical protein